MWVPPFFARLAGMVHVDKSSAISTHDIAATSSRRCPVSNSMRTGFGFIPPSLAHQMQLLPLRQEDIEGEGIGRGLLLSFSRRPFPFGSRINSLRHIAEDRPHGLSRARQGYGRA